MTRADEYHEGHLRFEQECRDCVPFCQHMVDHHDEIITAHLARLTDLNRPPSGNIEHAFVDLLIQDLRQFATVIETRWYG